MGLVCHVVRIWAQINISAEILAQYVVIWCKPPHQECAVKKAWCHVFNSVCVRNITSPPARSGHMTPFRIINVELCSQEAYKNDVV